jgi:hypothetical protein
MADLAWLGVVIIIIIIVVIVILFLRGKKFNKKDFKVTHGAKTNAHPWFGSGTNHSFRIDGEEAKILNVHRGQKYTFDISIPANHLFMITKSGSGGAGSTELTGSFTAANTGIHEWIVPAGLPQIIFYNCKNFKFLGYIIIVHN